MHPSVVAVFGVFFIQSTVLGNWIPRIPEVKASLGLSDSMLGLCLLAMPLGSLTGLTFAARVVEKIGLRDGCRLALPLWALSFILPAFATSPVALGGALFIGGATIALAEVAMNTEADVIESRLGKRLMSRCHGFWSLGSMAGAVTGSLFAHAGIALVTHLLLVLPVCAVLGYGFATRLPSDETPAADAAAASALDDELPLARTPADGPAADGAPAAEAPAPAGTEPLFRLPARSILALCAMPLGIMIVEGAFIDWSAVFLHSVLDASPLVIGTAYAFFAIVMAAVRLSGDAIADRVGDLAVVRVSGLAAAGGVALFALAPSVAVAYAGAALAGAGVAIVYPLAVSAAARRPGRSSADNVAALTMISFSAFLLGPPLIGFVSDVVGLRLALLVLSPLAFATFLLAGEVVRQPRNHPA